MARVKVNPIIERISGAFGELVFRHMGGRTVISRKADRSGHIPTPPQVAQRTRFRSASAFAVAAQSSESLGPHYAREGERRGISSYAAAMADALTDPVIEDVDVSVFTGAIHDTIYVVTQPGTGTEHVVVMIEGAGGEVLASGDASPANHGGWMFALDTELPSVSEVVVRVRAIDRPGNVTEETRTIELG